jgi:uncharacterized integral membrane protein (TIGR00698 family)
VRHLTAIAPGLLLASAIAVAANLLHMLPFLNLFNPIIMAILLGVAVQNLVGYPAWAKPGIGFAMRRVLRVAIILLGLQLTLAQVATLGFVGLGVIVLTVVATFAFTRWAGRMLGVDAKLAELIAAGTSICGASAVIATNTVTRAPDEDAIYAVACVTVFGTLAMFLFPLLPHVLHLDAQHYGLWAGSSIHEIAQVVAAAFQNSQDAGEYATITKLTRVVMLAPLVIGLSVLARGQLGADAAPAAKPPMPWFVLGFLALMVVNSMVAIDPAVKAAVAQLTMFLLCVALAAMGLETDLRKLKAKGIRPLGLGLASWIFVAAVSFILVKTAATLGA